MKQRLFSKTGIKCGFIISIFLTAGCSLTQKDASVILVGGPCEGCEAVFEFQGDEITSYDTLQDFYTNAQKLVLSGTIFKRDGITPAKDVVLYFYHTDDTGVYPTTGDENGWGRRHGILRGWIKTGSDGRYVIYTSMPGVYPDRTEPAHVHMTVLEPDGRYYWIDDVLFHGDPLIDKSTAARPNPRGGPGIVITHLINGVHYAERNIILGENISSYD